MKRLFIIIICLFVSIIYSRFTVSAFTPSQDTINKVINRVSKDTKYICFVNFSQPSGEERFFIYELESNRFIYSGLVQHGNGGKSTARRPEFSNAIGSNCSSLGLYKVLYKDKLKVCPFIDCFGLQGLDKTNSNAYKRGIVVHSSFTATLCPFGVWGTVLPLTFESQGCFAVSMNTMSELTKCCNKGLTYIYAYK